MTRAIDMVLLLIVVVFVINGIRRKAFAELIGFAGFVLAVSVALFIMEVASPAFAEAVTLRPEMAMALLFTLGFVVVLFLYKFIENWLVEHITLNMPAWLDRSLGSLFGFFKGSFIAGLLALFLSMIPAGPAIQQDLATSRVMPVAESIFVALYETIIWPIPTTTGLVQTLENTAEAFGVEKFNNRYLYTLRDLGSLKVEGWMETAKK